MQLSLESMCSINSTHINNEGTEEVTDLRNYCIHSVFVFVFFLNNARIRNAEN